MDLIPTLLGAAGIRYEEPRADVVDLTTGRPAPDRPRKVQQALGKTVSESELRAEAGR
jgi:hypothetical protein